MTSGEFQQFDYLYSKAEKLLRLRLGGELVKGVRSTARFAESRFKLLPFSKQVDAAVGSLFAIPPEQLFAVLDDALCEAVLILSVTALEVYLRHVSEQLGARGPHLLESIPALEKWSKSTGIDPFDSTGKAELNQVFQWRHVVVHSGGKVDKEAIRNGLKSVQEGDQASDKLTPLHVFQLLKLIRSVGTSVDRQYSQMAT